MKLLRRIRALFRKQKLDAGMSESRRLHLEQRARENIANGTAPAEARLAALRGFGAVEQAKEVARARRGFVWLEQLGQDGRYALRQFARAPGFTVVVVLTLALGIGATTAIYSVVDTVLLHPLPGPGSDRLVQVGQWLQLGNRPAPEQYGLSPPVVLAVDALRDDFFADVAWADGLQFDRRGEEFSTVVFGAGVPVNFFSLLGGRPMLGRTFVGGEAVPADIGGAERDAVIVVSHAWWQSDLGGDPRVLGQVVELSGKRMTIVGVMPAHFQFPSANTHFWLPMEPFRPKPRSMRAGNTKLFAQLRPGVTIAQSQAMLDTVAQRLMTDYPAGDRHYGDMWRASKPGGLQLWCRPLQEMLQGRMYTSGYDDLKRTLLGFLAAIGFVLAIVCANVANLTLARTERRQQELAIRAALGAGRARLMRQLLTENLLLAALGGAAGLLVTTWAMNALVKFNTMPRLRPVELDARVLGIALLVTLLTGLVFGLAPAWQAGRARVNDALNQGGTLATSGRAGGRVRATLVILEVALAVALLSGAGLMIRSVVQLLRVDPGFDPVNLLSVRPSFTGPASAALNTRPKRNAFIAGLHERLRALPGVSAVGLFKDSYRDEKVVPEGRDDPVLLCGAHVGVGDSDYFRAARIALLAGRAFEQGDEGANAGTVIVNETLARLCWPGEIAVGRKLRVTERPDAPTFEVIGVVRDARISRFDETIRPTFYRPYSEAGLAGASDTFVIRTQRDPASIVPAVRREILALLPGMRQPGISAFRQTLFDATLAQRTYRNYLAAFAGAGLLLSAIGIYGVLAYAVARRTREIGIRMALGADRRGVIRLVMGEGTRLIGLGIVAGLIAAFWLTKLLEKQLFGVSPHDPAVAAAVVATLTIVGLVACYLPARRAARVDPMVALRCE